MSDFKTESIALDPASGHIIRVSRKPDSGDVLFTDESYPGGVTLKELSGLNPVGRVLTVGSGPSSFATISEALEAAPNSSRANPTAIFVFPGTYAENVVVEKDGIVLVGFGATISPSTGDCLSIRASVSTTPRFFSIRGFRFSVPASRVGVKATGASGSRVGLDGIEVHDCHFTARGVGARVFSLQTICRFSARGLTGEWDYSPTCLASQVASVSVVDSDIPSLQVDHQSDLASPFETGCSVSLLRTQVHGDTQSTISGDGDSTCRSCSFLGDVSILGGRLWSFFHSTISGDLSVTSSGAYFENSRVRGGISGTGSCAYPFSGSEVFDSDTTKLVALPVPFPNDDYSVVLETGTLSPSAVTDKTQSGFRISFPSSQSLSVRWSIVP